MIVFTTLAEFIEASVTLWCPSVCPSVCPCVFSMVIAATLIMTRPGHHRLPAGRSAANPPAAAAAVDRWDRQTDGRTRDRYIDSAGRSEAESVKSQIQLAYANN